MYRNDPAAVGPYQFRLRLALRVRVYGGNVCLNQRYRHGSHSSHPSSRCRRDIFQVRLCSWLSVIRAILCEKLRLPSDAGISMKISNIRHVLCLLDKILAEKICDVEAIGFFKRFSFLIKHKNLHLYENSSIFAPPNSCRSCTLGNGNRRCEISGIVKIMI